MNELAALNIEALSREMEEADRILIGAGAGLSAAAGLSYLDSEAFAKYYPGMAKQGYHFAYELVGRRDDEWTTGRKWAYLSTHINYVRHIFPPAELYKKLLGLVEGKDWFVVTSNCDRQFMRTGFDMQRVFEYQDHYDTFGCTERCGSGAWYNYDDLKKAIAHIDPETFECAPEGWPRCPKCGALAEWAVRSDDWEENSKRYINFVNSSAGKRLCILELGVGFNTPGVIRWPFERICLSFPNSKLFRVNHAYRESVNFPGYPQVPAQLGDRAFAIDCDAAEVIDELVRLKK